MAEPGHKEHHTLAPSLIGVPHDNYKSPINTR